MSDASIWWGISKAFAIISLGGWMLFMVLAVTSEIATRRDREILQQWRRDHPDPEI